MTDNEIKARILTVGQALERIDWPNMSAEAAEAWCRTKAELLDTPAEHVHAVALGAMEFVIRGGSQNHPGAALDEAELDAETARLLTYSELSPEQREEVASRFPATGLFHSTRGQLAFDDYIYEVTSSGRVLNRKTLSAFEREALGHSQRRRTGRLNTSSKAGSSEM